MKALILFVTLIVSQSLFAGTGGGGIMKISPDASASEIVYHMGEQDGVVRFAYGQLIDQKWEIQELALSLEEVIENTKFVNAIFESQFKNDWVELK